MTRLQNLNNRYNRLIALNKENQFTQSDHPKIEKYYKLLLAVKKERMNIQCENVHPLKRDKVIQKITTGFQSEIDILMTL
jgi:hypothetical protein